MWTLYQGRRRCCFGPILQESGKSHSSSEDAPKARWKLMSRGKKEKKEKGLKHAAEKEGAPERCVLPGYRSRCSSVKRGAL